MARVRIAANVDPAPGTQWSGAWRATHVLTRVEAMGLLGPQPRPRRFDPAAFSEALEALELAGVARGLVAGWRVAPESARAGILAAIDDAIEVSPVPESEWPAVTGVLGDDLVARLGHASMSSVRRYRAGTRPTPDDVATRVHFLALVIADLAGAYNERGIRRWFSRPRPQLAGRAPQDLLAAPWRAEDDGPRAVAALAHALIGAGGAT